MPTIASPEHVRRLALGIAGLTASQNYGISDPFVAPVKLEQIVGFLQLCAPAISSLHWLAIHPAVLQCANLFQGNRDDFYLRLSWIRTTPDPDLGGCDLPGAAQLRRLVEDLGLLPEDEGAKYFRPGHTNR